MTESIVAVERHINASPALIYTCLADYLHHHPHFLPDEFSDFVVTSGGIGAGTTFTTKLKLLGRKNPMTGLVGEPEPGRVLTETVADQQMLTTFTVTPTATGATVRIETASTGKTNPLTWFTNHVLLPAPMKKVFAKELELMDEYVTGLAAREGAANIPVK